MILIFSNSYDYPTVNPVYEKLKSSGEDVVVYLADEVASGKTKMALTVEHDGETTFYYGNRKFTANDVTAAWTRRPDVFGVEEPKDVKIVSLNKQRSLCQDSLLYSINKSAWLNDPEHMQSFHQDKIRQLTIARKLGFNIPRTSISNRWQYAYDYFTQEEVIMKLPNGILYVDDEAHFLPTTIINSSKQKYLSSTSPFPGIFQEFIPKRKEWRVTIVDKSVYAIAIYSSKQARNDWRKHQFNDDIIQFKVESLPDDIQQKCLRMLKEMNLRYGAFDFIETNDHTFIFLEVNVNGQYQWLEDKLDLNISESIARSLKRLSALNGV